MIKSGTIESEKNFDPEVDACRLRLALKDGQERDIAVENTIAQLLVDRSNDQRQAINTMYNNLFKESICDDLRKVINKGCYFDTARALILPPHQFDSSSLRDGIEEGNDKVIAEILCTRTKEELQKLTEFYEAEYESSLVDDIDLFIVDNHKSLYIAFLQSPRNLHNQVDDKVTTTILDVLKSAEKQGYKLESSKDLVDTLTKHNFAQLRAAFKEFQKREGGNMEMLESSMRRLCKDDTVNMILITWVKSIKNVTQLFSELLYLSVTSLTADSARIIRIVVGRSEIDLTQIKSHYMMQYNKQLQLAVQQKCGNDHAYSNIISMVIKN